MQSISVEPLPPPPPWVSRLLERKEWHVPLLLMTAGILPLAFPMSQLCRFCEPLLPESLARDIGWVELGDWLECREAIRSFLGALEREEEPS